MKRGRLNLLLLSLVAALGLLVWLSPEPEPHNQAVPLTRLAPEDIQTIRISNHNGPSFALQRRGAGWWMREPYATAADANRIALLLEIVSTPSYEQFTVDQAALPEFGLDPPLARLQLNDLEIALGDTHPFNHNRYVATGLTLSLIKDSYPHHLLARAEAFISPRLLPADATIDAIITPDWQLVRRPREKRVWQLLPPAPGVSLDLLVKKAEDWKQARAIRVRRGSELPAGEPKAVSLRVGKETLDFLLLDQQGAGPLLLRKESGIVYELPAGSNLLASPAADLP